MSKRRMQHNNLYIPRDGDNRGDVLFSATKRPNNNRLLYGSSKDQETPHWITAHNPLENLYTKKTCIPTNSTGAPTSSTENFMEAVIQSAIAKAEHALEKRMEGLVVELRARFEASIAGYSLLHS